MHWQQHLYVQRTGSSHACKRLASLTPAAHKLQTSRHTSCAHPRSPAAQAALSHVLPLQILRLHTHKNRTAALTRPRHWWLTRLLSTISRTPATLVHSYSAMHVWRTRLQSRLHVHASLQKSCFTQCTRAHAVHSRHRDRPSSLEPLATPRPWLMQAVPLAAACRACCGRRPPTHLRGLAARQARTAQNAHAAPASTRTPGARTRLPFARESPP